MPSKPVLPLWSKRLVAFFLPAWLSSLLGISPGPGGISSDSLAGGGGKME